MLPVDTLSAFMQFILAIDDTQLIPLTLDENDFGNDKIRSKFRYEQQHQHHKISRLRSADVFRFRRAESHPQCDGAESSRNQPQVPPDIIRILNIEQIQQRSSEEYE